MFILPTPRSTFPNLYALNQLSNLCSTICNPIMFYLNPFCSQLCIFMPRSIHLFYKIFDVWKKCCFKFFKLKKQIRHLQLTIRYNNWISPPWLNPKDFRVLFATKISLSQEIDLIHFTLNVNCPFQADVLPGTLSVKWGRGEGFPSSNQDRVNIRINEWQGFVKCRRIELLDTINPGIRVHFQTLIMKHNH